MAWYNTSWIRRVSVVVALDKTLARVDLSQQKFIDEGFFNFVQNGGADIRVTKSDGTTEVARDVRSCDTTAQDGWIVFATGETASASTATYYIYIGNSGASDYAEDATYGSENAYDSDHVVVFSLDEDPSAGSPQFIDKTSNDNDGTANGTMTAGDSVAGQVDEAVDFDGTDDYITASPTFPAGDFTVYCLVYLNSLSGSADSMSGIDKSEAGTFGVFYHQINSSDQWNGAVINTSNVGADATDSSTATTGAWQFVATSYNDTSKVVALNVNGTEVDTGTLSGTRATATGSLYVGAAYFNGAVADFFDGQIDEYVLLGSTLTETQLDKIQEELLDNASAVTVGAMEAESPVPTFDWTYHGREYEWTLELFEAGFAGTTSTITGGRRWVARWGRNTNTLDERLRASEMVLEVIDPDLAVYDMLTGADSEEEDFTIKATDSTGTYTMLYKVRLDEVSTQLVTGLDEQITRIYAYCGIGEMQNIDAVVLSSSTVNNLFRLILVSSGISQDIEYFITHYAENSASSGALLDLHRLQRLDLIFANEGRKIDTMYDQLRSMAEGWGVVVMSGMDNQWHVKHDYSLGETLAGRGAQRYNVDGQILVSVNTITGTTKTLNDGIISRNSLRMPSRAVQAVQVVRGNDRKFFTVDLVKHGDFEEGWTSASAHEVWTANSGSTYAQSTDSDTGTYAMKVDDGSTITQKLLTMAGGQDLDYEIAVRYALRSPSGSGGSGFAQINLRYRNIDPENPTPLVTYYGDEDGWTTTSVVGFGLSTNYVGSASTLIYTTFVTTARGPLPDEDGELDLQLVSDPLSNVHDLFVDTLEVRVKSGDSAKNKFTSVSGRYSASSVVKQGDIVEQRVPWYNGLLGLDTDGDGTRNSVIEMVQVLTTATGDWIQASQFRSFTTGFTADQYDDLFQLTSEIRIAQQSVTTESIEVEILGIVPPDQVLVRDEKSYIQSFTEIDFETEVTRSLAHRKLIQATTEVIPIHLYWGDSDRQLRRAVIDADTTPWTAVTLHTIASGRTILHMRADEQLGYLFVLENLGSTKKLMRYDMDGTNPVTVFDDTTNDVFAFTLRRIRQSVLLIFDGSGTAVIREYDYDGNLLNISVVTETSVQKLQWVAVDPAETTLYYRKYNSVGPVDDTIALDLETGDKTTLLASCTLTDSGEINTAFADTDESKLWVFGSKSGSDRAIIEIPLPSGGSESDYKGTSDGLADEGSSVNRYLSKIAYSKGSGDIYWDNLTGTSEELIMDGGMAAPTIEAIDFGYN